ncbi:transposase [Plakobranchus ocellatus]|uniref:Transposase n=1 Tax=Plakobranchus ocellatus TaxID=259542 RepID=A0AAV4B9E1_9GAST|nr:transposase [Plakobranchus ocellatus]
MHIVFLDTSGVTLPWPNPPGTTVNTHCYKMIIEDKWRPAIRKNRPGLLQYEVIFHHDNVPVHTARMVDEYKWSVLEHLHYSPDLAPCDFFLFSKMKEHRRGHRFESEEDIIFATKEATMQLNKRILFLHHRL